MVFGNYSPPEIYTPLSHRLRVNIRGGRVRSYRATFERESRLIFPPGRERTHGEAQARDEITLCVLFQDPPFVLLPPLRAADLTQPLSFLFPARPPFLFSSLYYTPPRGEAGASGEGKFRVSNWLFFPASRFSERTRNCHLKMSEARALSFRVRGTKYANNAP